MTALTVPVVPSNSEFFRTLDLKNYHIHQIGSTFFVVAVIFCLHEFEKKNRQNIFFFN